MLVGRSPANEAKLDLIPVFKVISAKMHREVNIRGIPIIFSRFLILLIFLICSVIYIAIIMPDIGPITLIVLSGFIVQNKEANTIKIEDK